MKKVKVRQSRRLRQTTLMLGFCLAIYCFLFVYRAPANAAETSSSSIPGLANRPRLSPDVLGNLSLTEEQCNVYFPGLTKEIDLVVRQGPFEVKQNENAGRLGPLQGRIKDGQLYIIHAQRKSDNSKEMINSRTASLHQIHRAVVTSPEPLPDTVFTLNYQDQPYGTAWSYSRSADSSFARADARQFLMPHFSFWAWALPFIGSVDRAAGAIARIEADLPFASKIAKAVWRGTAWFNSVQSPGLRQNLLRAAKDQPWADVEALQWTGSGSREAANALAIEDFCRYKYIVHTEGVTYSGRFQFHQMCASVVVTPPIKWLQHTTHLVRPLFSSDLDLDLDPKPKPGAASPDSRAKTAGSGPAGSGGAARHGWVPSERVRSSWPVQYRPEEANIVFVAPDWSDLGATIAWLEDHPDVAEGIATRQRELFVGGGYFSPAAETCYWRALVRGWAKVGKTEGMGWEGKAGVTFEAFSLNNGD